MAVGAGSIKRASKLNAEAETKKNVAADAVAEKVPAEEAAEVVAENVPVKEAAEEKVPAKKTTTRKTTAKKTTEAKTTETKTTAKETTTRKTPDKKAAEENQVEAVVKQIAEAATEEVKSSVETSVIANIDPAVLDVVLGKKEKKNQACHLTEDMPIHLL